jgi:hypothetical protein
LGGSDRNTEHFGGFFLSESAKILQLNQTSLTWVHLAQTRESFIEHKQRLDAGGFRANVVVQFDLQSSTLSLIGGAVPSVVYKNTAHHN